MKITKNVMLDVPVTIELTAHDIEVIYLAMQPDDLGTWLKQLNDVAIFLKGSPVKILRQLNQAQAESIAGALTELAGRVLREAEGK